MLYSQSSNMLNQARLKVLKSRDDHVSNVLDDAKRQMISISKDQSKYPGIIQGLIAQVRAKLKIYKYRKFMILAFFNRVCVSCWSLR